MIAIFLSEKSIINLLTSSSTSDDFPAPPVPVIPKTGILDSLASSLILDKTLTCFLGQFSAADIILDIALVFFCCISSIPPFSLSPSKKSDFLTKSFIIPCNPIFLPSSG